MPRLPEAAALLLPRGEREARAAMLSRDLAEDLRLFGDTRLRAVELQQKHGRLGQREL